MRKQTRHGRKGLTLVEVLVTISIFGIVLAIIGQFFSSQSRAAAVQKGINEANEAARVALSLVTWDLQNAGFEVPVSNSNAAIQVPSENVGDHVDSFTIRFFDDNLAVPAAQRIRYDIAGTPGTLRRAQYQDDPTVTPSQAPTVAQVVAMNVVFEARANQFVDPADSTSCPAGSSPFPPGVTPVQRCEVDWKWQDVPDRLIRRVRVELLTRSERRIQRYTSPEAAFEFTDLSNGTTTSYVPTAGYAHHYTEQTISTPNLGR